MEDSRRSDFGVFDGNEILSKDTGSVKSEQVFKQSPQSSILAGLLSGLVLIVRQSAEEGRDETSTQTNGRVGKPKMEAQYAEAKGELILDLKEKSTPLTIKEFSTAGVRGQFNSQGEVKGRYNAARNSTTDFLWKPDGTGDWESKALEVTQEGDVIMITAKGTFRLESPTMIKWEGEGSYKTGSPRLAWLNNTKSRGEGTADRTKGESTGKIYAKK